MYNCTEGAVAYNRHLISDLDMTVNPTNGTKLKVVLCGIKKKKCFIPSSLIVSLSLYKHLTRLPQNGEFPSWAAAGRVHRGMLCGHCRLAYTLPLPNTHTH